MAGQETSNTVIVAPAAIMFLLGLALIVSSAGEFIYGKRAEDVSGLVRDEMSDDGLRQHRNDFEIASGLFERLQDDVLPALAERLRMSPAALEAEVRADYPAIGQLLDEQDEIVPFAESSLLNLERQQENFESSDSAPTSGLPAYSSAFLTAAVGLVTLASGATLLAARTRGTRLAAADAVIVSGLVLLGLGVFLRLPQKAADADTVLDTLSASPATVERTREAFDLSDAAATELDDRLLPDVARRVGVPVLVLKGGLLLQFPNVFAALEELPDVLERYEVRVEIRENGADDVSSLQDLPIRLLGWWWPAAGALLIAVGILAWVIGRGGAPVSAEARAGTSTQL